MLCALFAHFKQKLVDWRTDLIQKAIETLNLERSNEWADSGDFGDQASIETDHNIMLRLRDREKKLIKKIDLALEKIEDKSYGICEECEGKIGEKRLEARLVATLCIECKTAQERKEK